MGCCPSKCPGLTPRKEYAATTTEVAPILPPTGSANQVEPAADNAVQNMLMDRGSGALMDKSDDEEPVAEDHEPAKLASCKLSQGHAAEVANALDVIFVRVAEEVVVGVQPPPSPPRKSSRSADDIPISSTYHRVHSAVVAEQDAKRQEALQLEAEQREREMREYKAAMQQIG
ncbi:hypothetical protein PRNP1_004046 [Phytophthora ramorum]